MLPLLTLNHILAMSVNFNNKAADLGITKQLALFQQTDKAKELRFQYNLSNPKELRTAFMMYCAYLGTPVSFSKN